jgi:hypothetical protein
MPDNDTCADLTEGERVKNNLLAITRSLVRICEAEGLVLTVEQRPLQPLAMGHYATEVTLRQARGAQ